MKVYSTAFTTGLPSLDRALKGILPGDNIVWQVDTIEDYQALVTPFAEAGVASGRKTIYFRFACYHPPLILEEETVTRIELDPNIGFEAFIAQIHLVIERAGRGAIYVFDCLSELAADWYSDKMLGNFFMLTCPYLFDLETVAYFSIFRDYHSPRALNPIFETTQLFLDVYNYQDVHYIYPLKVHLRYSTTMNMLHEWKGNEFKPVTASVLISSILTSIKWSGLDSDSRPGFWERAFSEGEAVLEEVRRGCCPPEREEEMFQKLVRMMVSRDPVILKLVSRYMGLEDILEIRHRMIGSGLIGGKTVGMLLARRILQRGPERFTALLEAHDSFYIGSDVFFHLSGPQRRVVGQGKTEKTGDVSGRRRTGAAENSDRQVPGLHGQTVRTDAGLFRPGANNRTLQLSFGRQLRQTLSPVSTKVFSAPIKGRANAGWTTSSPRCAPSTPVA